MSEPIKYRYCRPETMGSDDYHEFQAHLGPEDGEYLASLAAEDYHSHHDGWESSWPIEIVLMEPNGAVIGTYSVDREMQPHFYARELESGNHEQRNG
jgi:hypothetical protein